MRAPPTLISKGQQPGSWLEQPSHGYWRSTPPGSAVDANCAFVHSPVSIGSPVNAATAVVATDIAPCTTVGPGAESLENLHPM